MTGSLRWIALLAAFSVLLGGCKIGSAPKKEASGKLVVLDVNEEGFGSEYLPLLALAMPNVDIQLVPYNAFAEERRSNGTDAEDKIIQDAMDAYKPDVIVTRDQRTFRYLQENGRLKSLQTDIAKDERSLHSIIPELLLHLNGNDGLPYALASRITGRAIYYNRDEFARVGVPAPTDGMTWNQVFELGARFASSGTGNAKRYGIYVPGSRSPFSVLLDTAGYEGLRYVDQEGRTMTMRTPEWTKVWQTVADAYRSNAIYRALPGQADEDPYEMFANGRIAMLFGDETAVGRIEDQPFDWGIVTEPIDPERPDTGRSLRFQALFSVNYESAQRELAWNAVKTLAAGGSTGIPMDSAKLKATYGSLDLSAFYKLKMDEEQTDAKAKTLPAAFYMSVFAEGTKAFEEVVAGSMTVDQAQLAIENAGNKALTLL